MTVINTYLSKEEAQRRARLAAICRRCILLLAARRGEKRK